MVNAWFSGSFLPSSIRLVGRSLVLRPTFPPTPFPSVTSWDEWRVWVKDGGRNEDPTEAIRSEGNVRRWHTVNGIGYAWSLVVWCRVISSHRSLPLHCRLGSVRSLTTFLSLTSPYSERSDWNGVGRSWVRGPGSRPEVMRERKGPWSERRAASTSLTRLGTGGYCPLMPHLTSRLLLSGLVITSIHLLILTESWIIFELISYYLIGGI